MATAEAILPRAHARMRRVDMRWILGVLLMLVAIIGGAAMVHTARARIPVLVAAASVQPGQVIADADLRVSEVALSPGIAYLSASARDEVVGKIATEPWWPGKIVSAQSASQAPPLGAGEVAMSIALKPDHAAGGVIRSGDHVAVIASTQANQGPATASVLLADVAVLAVTDSADTTDTGATLVTLRLRLDQARTLAAARAAGSIDLVELSGAHP